MFEQKIISFPPADNINKDSIGTKAYNLAQCSRLGIKVPSGIIIPADAVTIRSNSSRMESLAGAIEKLFPDDSVLIIRSSAVSEDGMDKSFAGQFLSLICNNNVAGIMKACEACWNSCVSVNISAYTSISEYKDQKQYGRMALLVQRLIPADCAGVCFTCDPLTGKKGKYFINAVHGLGSALVDSEVVADHYEYDTEKNSVSVAISGKQHKWRSAESPSMLTGLPETFKGRAALNESQILSVCEAAYRLSDYFKTPLDIEWAFERETLYILQARPVTPAKKKGDYQVWTRDNAADVIPGAVTPLTWSFVKRATNDGFVHFMEDLGIKQNEKELFRLFDDRVYLNHSAYQAVLKPDRNPLNIFSIAVRYLILIALLSWKARWVNKKFIGKIRKFENCRDKSDIVRMRTLFESCMKFHIRVALLLEFGLIILRKMISSKSTESESNKLIEGIMTGLDKIESVSFSTHLAEIAWLLMEDENDAEKLRSMSVSDIPAYIRSLDNSCSKKWNEFLKVYGYSSMNEFELFYPRWREDPSFVSASLKGYLSKEILSGLKQKSETRIKIRKESEKLLKKKIPWHFTFAGYFYIRHVQQCSILRESFKQKLVRIVAAARWAVLSFARSCKSFSENEVFFITVEEMMAAHGSEIDSDTLHRAEKRREDWQKNLIREPYKEIRLYGDGRMVKSFYEKGYGDTLTGLSLSGGTCSGTARVIRDASDSFTFNPGDILVAPSINPSWTPLFTLAGAVVTDMGNFLSHGAIIARELGIPAVGNVFDATKRIVDGQQVVVDGDNGVIFMN